MNLKIISGGQTGIDRIALEVARELVFPAGGSAPRDFTTELGSDHFVAHAPHPQFPGQESLDRDGRLCRQFVEFGRKRNRTQVKDIRVYI
jgi:hypothetical protein